MLKRTTTSGGAVIYQSPLLLDAGVRHAFTTRLGGVSDRPFASLNLGNPLPGVRGVEQDSADHLRQNLQIAQHAIDCADMRRRWCTQVHGNGVAVVDQMFEDGIEADGLITKNAGDVLIIRVADCAPALLSTPDGSMVAAVHAGWRGVAAGIIPEAVAMLGRYSSHPSDRLIAAIGPCIGPRAFEVGPEVSSIFAAKFGPDVVRKRLNADRATVDLRQSIDLQLRQSGLQPSRIDHTDRCTFYDADEFFSHRRDHGVTGRMAALISPTAS